MSKKILVLVRKTKVLRIYDETHGPGEYSAIYNVTGLKAIGEGWYDIYNTITAVGFVSGVKEVKEKW